jgi:hypothetical protein
LPKNHSIWLFSCIFVIRKVNTHSFSLSRLISSHKLTLKKKFLPMEKVFTIQFNRLISLFVLVCLYSSPIAAQLQVSVINNPVTCFGLCNGSASASVTGGTSPYQYIWNTGHTTITATGLCANTYDVTVTDAAGATAVAWANITQPQQLNVQAAGSDQICGLNPAGTATATPSGGTAPYAYTWSNGGTTAQITGLVAGNYTVTTTDSKGCTAVVSASVIFSNEGIWMMDSTSNVSCFGFTNGYLSVSPMSGSAPYTYAWSNGATTKSISGLAPGNYTVTVNEAGGCFAIRTLTINQPAVVAIATSSTQALCSALGSATASASGGNGGFTYNWSNTGSGATISAGAGIYTVTATDSKGCSAAQTATIANGGNTISASISIVTNPGCAANGSVSVAASGGSGNYSYAWSNGSNTASTSVTAGTYGVTATDNTSGCSTTSSITVNATSAPTASATVNTNATCSTGGSATASATGGTGAYTYLWSNTQTSATATNLSGGTYTVVVRDAAGCSSTATVTITQSQGPSASATAVSAATCLTGGSATASATGGTGAYTYLWDNTQTSATATNLSAGVHSVSITDAAGCLSVAQTTIQAASLPSASISASSNATCGQGGSATVTASGGVTPYTYLWSNTSTSATATNLAAGTYTVTVTAANGCTKTTTVTIGLTNNGVKVGDTVWYDDDQDGLQETGDVGVAGMSVMLLTAGPDGVFGTADDITKASTITGANGKYLFDCVEPGTYIIMFGSTPSGYQFTEKDAVNNDCKDSDANQSGKTAPFTISAGSADNLCLDAGIHILCSNVTFPGTIGDDQTICEGETPVTLSGVAPPSGGSGALQYIWMTLDKSGPTPTWVGIPNTNSPSYNPGPLFATAHFMRCVFRAGCVTPLETNIVTITVKPAGSPGCTQFLTSFVVAGATNQAVSIAWSVPHIDAHVSYLVQHSSDKINWTNLHTQSSLNQLSYTYLHLSPQSGTNHYRIVRTDLNGNTAYSDPKSYSLTTAPVTIYPNPGMVSAQVYMRNHLAYSQTLTVTIHDATGRIVGTVELEKGQLGDIETPLQHLSAGLYYVRVMQDGEVIQTTQITRY